MASMNANIKFSTFFLAGAMIIILMIYGIRRNKTSDVGWPYSVVLSLN